MSCIRLVWEKANKQHESIKCGASELLSLYGLLRHFSETRLPNDDGRIQDALRSFMAICKAVDILLLAKRGALPMARAGGRLKAALVDHMEAHQRAHGAEKIKPKAHWAFDVAEQLTQDDYLFDAFIIERLHLRVRNIAENIKLNHSFERSVLSGVLNDHARRALDANEGGGLIGAVAPLPQVDGAFVADKLEFGGFRVAVSDYVFRGEELGIVVACCVDSAILYVIVDVLQQVSELSPHSSVWRHDGSRRFVWKVSEVSECLAWQQRPGSELLVVRM